MGKRGNRRKSRQMAYSLTEMRRATEHAEKLRVKAFNRILAASKEAKKIRATALNVDRVSTIGFIVSCLILLIPIGFMFFQQIVKVINK